MLDDSPALRSTAFQGISPHAVLLLICILIQYSVFLISPFDPEYIGDESYYVSTASNLLNNPQEALQQTEIYTLRPIGYPVTIAIYKILNHDPIPLRFQIASLQFYLITAVLIIFYMLATFILGSSRKIYPVVLILGISPWAYGYSKYLYPDSLNASFLTLGLLALFGYIRARKSVSHFLLLLSTFVLSMTAFLRIEMVVLAPIFLLTGICLRHFRRIAPYLIIVSLAAVGIFSWSAHDQILKTGKFSKFSILKKGAYEWVETWFATERTGFNYFLYDSLTLSKFSRLPKHAFADEFERNQIRKAVSIIEEKGSYVPEADAIFHSVAQKRKADHYWLNFVLPRAWSYIHIWMNTRLNESMWTVFPREGHFFKLLYVFSVMKLVIFALALFSVVNLFVRLRRGTVHWYDDLTVLMLVCILGRTLLMGGSIGWIHRYAVAAWPAMLWCAISAFFIHKNIKSDSDSSHL